MQHRNRWILGGAIGIIFIMGMLGGDRGKSIGSVQESGSEGQKDTYSMEQAGIRLTLEEMVATDETVVAIAKVVNVDGSPFMEGTEFRDSDVEVINADGNSGAWSSEMNEDYTEVIWKIEREFDRSGMAPRFYLLAEDLGISEEVDGEDIFTVHTEEQWWVDVSMEPMGNHKTVKKKVNETVQVGTCEVKVKEVMMNPLKAWVELELLTPNKTLLNQEIGTLEMHYGTGEIITLRLCEFNGPKENHLYELVFEWGFNGEGMQGNAEEQIKLIKQLDIENIDSIYLEETCIYQNK